MHRANGDAGYFGVEFGGAVLPRSLAIAFVRLRTACSARHLALVLGVTLSAFATAYAASNARAAWLGFFAMIPLFAVVRILRPLPAAAFGALWGACFVVELGWTGVALKFYAASGLIGLSATFAGLGALLSMWIGFTPFVLGVGWMLTQAAMSNLAPKVPLLHSRIGDSTWLEMVGGSLGYGAIAFLVGYVNAVLVAAVATLRLQCPRRSTVATSTNSIVDLSPQIVGCFTPFALQPSHPRAPPRGVSQCGCSLGVTLRDPFFERPPF